MPVINENKYNSYQPGALVELLQSNKISLNDLEPKNNNHLQAALNFYRDNRSRLTEFSSETEFQFLLEMIKKDYKFFVYLDQKQYRNDITQEFIIQLLKDNKYKRDGEPIIPTYLSYDKKIVIPYEYKTNKGDEIYYFDSELQVPASLVSSFKTAIKIEDPIEFIKMLDVDIRSLQPAQILDKLYYVSNTSFRKVLFELVSKDGVGYYKVTNSLVEIEQKTIREINDKFQKGCAVATNLIINKIEVDREVRDKIESEFFELRKKRINIDEELKYQKDSMELFAKKLELLNKYSAPKEMLTEAEKDKAFDRYARKGLISTVGQLPSSKLEDKQDEKVGESIELEADKVTVERKKWYFYARLFGGVASGFIAFILSLVFFISGRWPVALLSLGIVALLYGALLLVTAIAEKKSTHRVLDNVKQYDDVK